MSSQKHLRYKRESASDLASFTRRDNASGNAPSSTLVSSRVWEVEAPAPVSSLKVRFVYGILLCRLQRVVSLMFSLEILIFSSQQGALIPRALTGRRRRKVSIEVHQIDSKASGHKGTYEECIVRLLTPAKKAKSKHFRSHRHDHHHNKENGNDNYEDYDDDDSTVAPVDSKDLTSSNFASPEFFGWHEKYRMPLRNITIKGTNRTRVFVQVTLGRLKQTRQLIFDTMEQAEDFRKVLSDHLDLENDRNREKLKVLFDGKPPPEKTEITFLVEILSGWDLPVGDLKTSDPYVVCSFNGKDVHRTQHINNT